MAHQIKINMPIFTKSDLHALFQEELENLGLPSHDFQPCSSGFSISCWALRDFSRFKLSCLVGGSRDGGGNAVTCLLSVCSKAVVAGRGFFPGYRSCAPAHLPDEMQKRIQRSSKKAMWHRLFNPWSSDSHSSLLKVLPGQATWFAVFGSLVKSWLSPKIRNASSERSPWNVSTFNC